MTDRLWQFRFRILTNEGEWTRAEWDSMRHREIEVASGVEPHNKHLYSREDLHAAFRWQAGVLARLMFFASSKIMDTERRTGHRCDADNDLADPCGISYWAGIEFPSRVVDEAGAVPLVLFSVPANHDKKWMAVIEEWLGQIVSDDRTLPPAPTRRGAHHEHIALADPTADPRGATPR